MLTMGRRKLMIYTIDEISSRIRPVAEKYHLKAVYLFGSYARGEARDDSDVDLLVDLSGADLSGFFAIGGLYNDLEAALQKEVDLITTDLEDSGLLSGYSGYNRPFRQFAGWLSVRQRLSAIHCVQHPANRRTDRRLIRGVPKLYKRTDPMAAYQRRSEYHCP